MAAPTGRRFSIPAGAVDRRARGRRVRPERRLGRHRRSPHPQPHLGRPGRLPLDRRRQDVDAARASSRPGASAAWSSIPRIRTSALVCALGHAYGPQPERGVFRTTDGGKTWAKTLFVDENTGCSDLAMDPKNPRMLFAGMWQLEIHTWGRESGGPGSGLFKSTRWRRDLDAPAGPRPADAARRQGRGRDCAVEHRIGCTR